MNLEMSKDDIETRQRRVAVKRPLQVYSVPEAMLYMYFTEMTVKAIARSYCACSLTKDEQNAPNKLRVSRPISRPSPGQMH